MIGKEQLRKYLELQGLELLVVEEHRRDREQLVVYLHGNAGQWADGYAVEVVRGAPGVLDALESVGTPTIILVRLMHTDGESYAGQQF